MTDARLIAKILYLVLGATFKEHRRWEVDESSRIREEPCTRDQAYFQMKPTATARGEQGGRSGGEVATHEKPPSSMSLRVFVLASFSSRTAMSSRCGSVPAFRVTSV